MQHPGNLRLAFYRTAMLLFLLGALGIGSLRIALAQDTPLLRVSLAASATSAVAGEVVEFTITVTNNTDGARDIVVRDDIDRQLVVQRAASSAGSCQASNPVTCAFQLAQGASATITISVRVRSTITSAGQLLNQAVAEDDLGDSIGSNTVIIAVQPAAPALPPTSTPAPSVAPTNVPATPVAPTALPPAATSEPASAVPATLTRTPRPTATPKPTRKRDDDDDDDDDDKTDENTATPEQRSATDLPTTSVLETPPLETSPQATPTLMAESPAATPRGSGTFPNVTQPEPMLAAPSASISPAPSATPDQIGPTIAPAQENAGAVIAPTAPPNASEQSGELPHTAATVPAMGIGLALLGIALVLHATRRVRRAEADLREKTAVERLTPFVRAALWHQRKTIETLDQAQKALELQQRTED